MLNSVSSKDTHAEVWLEPHRLRSPNTGSEDQVEY